MGRLRWTQFAGAVWASTVVMANVLGERQTQVPLTEDQYAVGEFGSDGADEPLGETVRLRAARRNPDYLDAHIGEDGVEGCGELASPVANEDPELGHAIAEIHHEVADLLGGPSAIGVGGRVQQVYATVSDFKDEEDEIRLRVTAQSAWKKSQASIVDAWARRNCRHAVSGHRAGAGGIRNRCRTRRMVDAPTRWPS